MNSQLILHQNKESTGPTEENRKCLTPRTDHDLDHLDPFLRYYVKVVQKI